MDFKKKGARWHSTASQMNLVRFMVLAFLTRPGKTNECYMTLTMTSSYIRELQNKSKIECLTSYSSPEKFVLASESNLVIFSLSFISSFMSSNKKTNERAIAVKSKNRNDSAQSVCLCFSALCTYGKTKKRDCHECFIFVGAY